MSAGRRRLLVVGNGMVGERLVDDLTRRGGLERWDVTVVGDEPYGAYNRVMLGKVLAGAEPDAIVTSPPAAYAEAGIGLRTGTAVRRLDTASRVAHLTDGTCLPYDHAVLATGSRPVLPPVAGLSGPDGELHEGVHVYRSLDDVQRLRRDATGGGPGDAAVVGGGLLGLEAARALLDLGHRVTVVHTSEALLNAQLDDVGGRFLRRAVEALGLRVAVGQAATLLAHPGRRPDALALSSGEVVPARLVVVAVGVRPRIEVATASGITTNLGVVVDDELVTSAAGVSAIGDCAEHPATTGGLVAPGWDQAAVLADRLSGADPDATYTGTTPYTRLKVAGVDVAVMGESDAPGDDPDVEVVQVIQERRGVYRKLVVRAGVLVGAVVVGDPLAGPTLFQQVLRGERVAGDPVDLLCSPSAWTGTVAPAAEVCSCNHVGEPEVVAAIADGCTDLDRLKACTRAGTGCGSCVGSLTRLLAEHAPPSAGAAPVEGDDDAVAGVRVPLPVG